MELELTSTIGYSGNVQGGLQCHPDGEHLVFTLGCNVVIESIDGAKNQSFLRGHNDLITCMTVSPCGRYVASGQQSNSVAEADVVVWDYQTRSEMHRFSLHKQHVQSLAFSDDGEYLVTLGGIDDGTVALWSVTEGKVLSGMCSGDSRSGEAVVIKFVPGVPGRFMTGGSNTLRLWSFEPGVHKLQVKDCNLGSLRRRVTCITYIGDFAYCGTDTGDALVVAVKTGLLKSVGPEKKKFSLGIKSLVALGNGDLLIGAGDGSVVQVNPARWNKPKQTCTLDGACLSLALRSDGQEFFVGSSKSNMYHFELLDFASSVRVAAHASSVNDICFPAESSELYGTCSNGEIRIWHTTEDRELLRISYPGAVCQCMAFTASGDAIISGWDDAVIRVYLPQSGRLAFETRNANGKGVTALASSNDGERVLSGGGDGQLRVWEFVPGGLNLVQTLKEHNSKITAIHVTASDRECITSSVDGTCIVWDLKKYIRNTIVFQSTLFTQVRYFPDESQFLTVGTDRKVGYWEVFDGSLIRELHAAEVGSLTTVSIAPDGSKFLVGGTDKLLKLYDYKEGVRTHVGIGHSGSVTRAVISPAQDFIISGSADGAIYRWAYPKD